MPRRNPTLFLPALVLLCSLGWADELGKAIFLSEKEFEKHTRSGVPAKAASSGPASGFTVDTLNRNSVLSIYHKTYLASENFEATHGWTGDVDNCNAGTISFDLVEDSRRRINFMRAMAGLNSDITFDATKNGKCQEAALIMSRQGALSHFPGTDFPGNPCLSEDGEEAASKGNLSLGRYGPRAIDGQMIDDGPNNTAVGHRRWILFSRATEMGTGDIPGDDNPGTPIYLPASCIWVIGDFGPAPSPDPEIKWPPEGFVPFNLVPNDSEQFPRWSFGYPGADFSSATVTMTRGGIGVPVTLEPVFDGAGDNTLVWRPSGIPASTPIDDVTYTVTISGISGAPFSNKTYDVTVINPFDLGEEATVTGDPTPPTGRTTVYSFNPISEATAYTARISEYSAGTWAEGAEASPPPQVIDGTDSSYPLFSSAFSETGSRSFHLSTPDLEAEDFFVVSRQVVPEAGSEVQFQFRRRWMHTSTILRVEVSEDGGQSFQTIHSIAGQTDEGVAGWDPDFIAESIPIPAHFHGREIRLRFRIEPTGLTYFGTDQNYGIFIDDVSVTNHLEITGSTIQNLAGSASGFDFMPDTADKDYLLSVNPEVAGRFWGYGPELKVRSREGLPGLTVTDIAVGEDAGTASFTVMLSPTSGNDVTFDYATSDITATAGIDYSAVSDQATILAGASSAVIQVTIAPDTLFEPDETFRLTLSNPANAEILNGTATGTINNVSGSGPYPPLFPEFAFTFGISPDPAAGLDSDDDGDSDYGEWAMGGFDPIDPNAVPPLIREIRNIGGTDYFTLSYLRIIEGVESGSIYLRGDTRYEARGTFNLAVWNAIPIPVSPSGDLPAPPTGYEWGSVRLPFSVEAATNGFLNVVVSPIE